MRGPDAGNGAGELRADIDRGCACSQVAAQRRRQADRRIEMRAGYRAERQDEDGQDRASGNGVAKERERAVAAGKPRRHDAGADHRREQKRGAQAFSGSALRQ